MHTTTLPLISSFICSRAATESAEAVSTFLYYNTSIDYKNIYILQLCPDHKG
jgi:hypothetical protein